MFQRLLASHSLFRIFVQGFSYVVPQSVHLLLREIWIWQFRSLHLNLLEIFISHLATTLLPCSYHLCTVTVFAGALVVHLDKVVLQHRTYFLPNLHSFLPILPLSSTLFSFPFFCLLRFIKKKFPFQLSECGADYMSCSLSHWFFQNCWLSSVILDGTHNGTPALLLISQCLRQTIV